MTCGAASACSRSQRLGGSGGGSLGVWSPSPRGALWPGRGEGHHLAAITEVSTGFPGYDGYIPFENGFLSEILRGEGYNTYAVGKAGRNLPGAPVVLVRDERIVRLGLALPEHASRCARAGRTRTFAGTTRATTCPQHSRRITPRRG